MNTVLAIVLGVAAGVAGFLCLFAGLKLSRRATSASVLGQFGVCLIGVLASFILLIVVDIIFVKVARPFCLPFVLAEGISLCVSAISYGIARILGKSASPEDE